MEEEGRLLERVDAADLRGEGLKVLCEVFDVERHLRDYDRLGARTGIGGMVVMDSLIRSGLFVQIKVGDQL